MASFLGLSVDLTAVLQFAQQLGDAAGGDLMPHRAQCRSKLGVALRHPQQRPRRITHRRRIEQLAQILQQRRVCRRQGLPPAANTTNRSLRESRRYQIIQPAADGTRRNPRRARHRRNAAVTRRSSLHRRKQAPSSLIQAWKQGLVACANRILVDHAATIHSTHTSGNPRLQAYPFSPQNADSLILRRRLRRMASELADTFLRDSDVLLSANIASVIRRSA